MILNAEPVLIVDDDLEFSKLAKRLLTRAGYPVATARSADDALAQIRKGRPAAVILDIGLPGVDGRQLCEILRREAATEKLPILMVTGEAGTRARVQGLDAGADDYLEKPFEPAELLARLKALLRRAAPAGVAGRELASGGLHMNLDTREVLVQGRPIRLRRKEFEFLRVLMESRGNVMTSDALMAALWGERVVGSDLVYTYVTTLRKKLGPMEHLIETIHGVGYRFHGG